MSNKSAWERWKDNLGDTRPWDLLDPSVERASDEEASKRFDACRSCPELIKLTNQCKKCGCLMHLKTKLQNATCPIEKW
jgi:hypothetical protein